MPEMTEQQINALSRAELIELAVIQDKLLEGRNAVLDAIPPCPEHGGGCVPHALDWVRDVCSILNQVPKVL